MKKLIALTLILFLSGIVFAQSRIPNLNRIATTWNSISPAIDEWNKQMQAADRLLHDRFNPKVVTVDPDGSRKQTVAHYKAAKEALLNEVDALNTLIEEEDY